MAKIILKRNECIGCGACTAVCSELFEMDDDNKAHLKGSEKVEENEELQVDDAKCAEEAVEVCPVKIIEVKD